MGSLVAGSVASTGTILVGVGFEVVAGVFILSVASLEIDVSEFDIRYHAVVSMTDGIEEPHEYIVEGSSLSILMTNGKGHCPTSVGKKGCNFVWRNNRMFANRHSNCNGVSKVITKDSWHVTMYAVEVIGSMPKHVGIMKHSHDLNCNFRDEKLGVE